MSGRTLIAYYSMSGNTERLAGELRAALGPGADLEPIREPRPRRGALGALRGMLDSLFRRTPPIEPAAHDPAAYDLLVLGGPVWAGRIAGPVRSYVQRLGEKVPRVAFFCTLGGHGADSAFLELEGLCHRAPQTTLAVDARHLPPDAHREDLARFARVARAVAG